ncbi:hypothetical protein C0J52_18539 [Blattella germanica]|nr:hypothetical protein C0J52_18539 [Blattella germanica]
MSCGYYHSAFLGLPDSLTNITTPQKVTLAVPVKSVFCGGNHTMVLTADGEVFAFGNNFNGQLGLGTEITQNILPTKVIGLEGHIVKEISCGESHTAFITENGNLYTCGEGRHGKLCSEQDNNNQTVPIRVSKFKGYTVKKDESMIPTLNNRGGTLPPLQRVPIQSPNNNSETTSFFNETQDNHLEELLEQTEVREIEKDMEVKSAITESKTSNSDNSNITSNSNSDRLDDLDDIDADEESSVKSSRPDSKKEPGKKDMRDTSTAMDIIEDDIKSADDKSAGESGSDSDSESGDDDNDNVKVEPVAKKESRVSRFFNTFRLKKPTSAQSAGLEASGERLVIKEKRQRAGSEGRVFRKEHGAGDAEEDRGDSGKSKDSNLGNERRVCNDNFILKFS